MHTMHTKSSIKCAERWVELEVINGGKSVLRCCNFRVLLGRAQRIHHHKYQINVVYDI